jgi:hypothetical protein
LGSGFLGGDSRYWAVPVSPFAFVDAVYAVPLEGVTVTESVALFAPVDCVVRGENRTTTLQVAFAASVVMNGGVVCPLPDGPQVVPEAIENSAGFAPPNSPSPTDVRVAPLVFLSVKVCVVVELDPRVTGPNDGGAVGVNVAGAVATVAVPVSVTGDPVIVTGLPPCSAVMVKVPRVVPAVPGALKVIVIEQLAVPPALAASPPEGLFSMHVPAPVSLNVPVPEVTVKWTWMLVRLMLPVSVRTSVEDALVVEVGVLNVSDVGATLAPNLAGDDPTSIAPASIVPVKPFSPGSGRRLPKKSVNAVGYDWIALAGMLFEPAVGA